MTFKAAYGIGFGLALGGLTAILIVDTVRAWRVSMTPTEPLVIEVRPELWTDPDYDEWRNWKARQGGHV